MVCLIGANEAGKSSALSILAGSHVGDTIVAGDRSRREAVPDDRAILTLHYRLDAKEQAMVAALYGDSPPPQWLTVTMKASGDIDTAPDRWPRRDRSARLAARDALAGDAVRSRLTSEDGTDDEGEAVAALFGEAEIEAIEVILDATPNTLPASDIDQLDAIAARMREVDELILADLLTAAAAAERLPHPSIEARELLWANTPDFVAFAQIDRELATEYDLDAVAVDPPRPLANLARLAKLDLKELLRTIHSNETGTVELLERQANAELARVFEAWSQTPKVAVTINISGTLLLVHVTTGSDVPMRLDERSDGLRQFVALVAASAQDDAHGPPILLIDEIETHLHYDAQADLLSILAAQTQAHGDSVPPIGQVIYTTHSAACLPDDLGSVRVIDSDPERGRSAIRNQFWTDEPGLGPLLMAMGAATLAFVPRRAALVAEGPSELILLPTLIRQAIETEHLGYQIAPGSSSARPGSIIGFDLEAPRTAWVVDADDGGTAISEKLVADGIDPGLVFSLRSDDANVMLENLIDVGAYRDAVNAYLADKGSQAMAPEASDLLGDRPRAVAHHCEQIGVRPPSKVIIANKLLAMRSERRLIAAEHVETLRDLHRRVTATLAPGNAT